MKELDLAYLAGFFDGEGCVGIYPNGGEHRGYCLSVQITQNQSQEFDSFIQEVMDEYGGSLCSVRDGRAWHYSIGSAPAVRFLEALLPYVRLKKEEIEVGLEWQSGRQSKRQRGERGRLISKTPEENQRDLEFSQRIASLKSRNQT